MFMFVFVYILNMYDKIFTCSNTQINMFKNLIDCIHTIIYFKKVNQCMLMDLSFFTKVSSAAYIMQHM